jgi:hypothetical protein
MKKQEVQGERQGSRSLYQELASPDTMEEFPRDAIVALELREMSVLEFVVA